MRFAAVCLDGSFPAIPKGFFRNLKSRLSPLIPGRYMQRSEEAHQRRGKAVHLLLDGGVDD